MNIILVGINLEPELAFVVDLLFIWTTILTLLCINQINLCNSKPSIEGASQILTPKEKVTFATH